MSGTYRVTNVSDARTWQRIADTVNQTGLDAGWAPEAAARAATDIANALTAQYRVTRKRGEA